MAHAEVGERSRALYPGPARHRRPARAEPALTVEQLKAIALDEKWRTLK
ncbi:hypothetical protein [Streptomyces sannanensis]